MEEEGNEVVREQAQQTFSVYPEAVIEHILGYLNNEALLAARGVCSDWRRIVDDNYDAKIWKPHFARHRMADVLLQFRLTRPGTRLSSAEEVNHFMENHSENRPFISHTLIINSRTVAQHRGLCEVFPELVARFGGFVRHCIYYVNESVPESVHLISTIFQMANLRSLSIYCFDWNREGIRNRLNLENIAVQPLRDFQSLTVLGANSYIFLQRIAPAYGPQIKQLRYWYYPNLAEVGEDEPRFATFPSLEEVKVCGVSRRGLLTWVRIRNHWPLKRLSMKMMTTDNDVDRINFGNVLSSIRRFAGTLESFHLQGAEENLLGGCGLSDRTPQFPNVTDLRVPYFFQRHHVLIAMSRIFFNMKHFQLVDSEDTVWTLLENNGRRNGVIGEMLEPLWQPLPVGLEMISVRYRKYDEAPTRGIIHKYFQMRNDPNGN